MRSSYKKNNYGKVFYDLVRIHKPEKMVELGVLDGYSSLHFAKGLKDNNKGRLYCYDLWDEYNYNHGNFDKVFTMLYNEGVKDRVTLRKGDAFKVHKDWRDNEIDMLHVDISNDGDIVCEILNLWHNKVSKIIAFEGGTQERDNIEWMIKYSKKPILPVLCNNKIIDEEFDIINFLSFPGLILMFKKKYRQGIIK